MSKLAPADLLDMGICPTCYDRKHGHCLYGNPADRMLYENEWFECLLIANPRAPGHTIISTKEHYKDMMALPDQLCREIYSFARRTLVALKAVCGAESVYLCTMCDGPMNHFHVQMIPRYAHERRGSRNFVKERGSYVEDREMLLTLREFLNNE